MIGDSAYRKEVPVDNPIQQPALMLLVQAHHT